MIDQVMRILRVEGSGRVLHAVHARLLRGRLCLPGIDVALHTRRIAVLRPDGQACGSSFTIVATTEAVPSLRATLQARGAHRAHTIVGLEATAHMWKPSKRR